jgi:hypothetical protein
MSSTESHQKWDVFIAHASEDKEAFVRPLATVLQSLGMSVWYDEFSLQLGDSLSRSIDKGILGSQYGLVIVSPAFIEKKWPEYELRGLITREVGGKNTIIPVWHGVDKRAVEEFSPSLADKIALQTTGLAAQDIALQILAQVRPDLYNSHPRSELIELASGEHIQELQKQVDSLKKRIELQQHAYYIQNTSPYPMSEPQGYFSTSVMTGPMPIPSVHNARGGFISSGNSILAKYLMLGYDFDTADRKASEEIQEIYRKNEIFAIYLCSALFILSLVIIVMNFLWW